MRKRITLDVGATEPSIARDAELEGVFLASASPLRHLQQHVQLVTERVLLELGPGEFSEPRVLTVDPYDRSRFDRIDPRLLFEGEPWRDDDWCKGIIDRHQGVRLQLGVAMVEKFHIAARDWRERNDGVHQMVVVDHVRGDDIIVANELVTVRTIILVIGELTRFFPAEYAESEQTQQKCHYKLI